MLWSSAGWHVRIIHPPPPTPKYKSTWDVEVVLNHLERLGSCELLDDTQLSHKLAMLLAITTAGRASELQGLSLDYMADRGSNISFSLAKLTKTCRPGKKCKEIIIHEFTDRPRLDPVKCLRQYILRTVGWRQTEKQHSLLLGIVAPHNPVATSTISNWLKKLMRAAGIDVSQYQGHSTR